MLIKTPDPFDLATSSTGNRSLKFAYAPTSPGPYLMDSEKEAPPLLGFPLYSVRAFSTKPTGATAQCVATDSPSLLIGGEPNHASVLPSPKNATTKVDVTYQFITYAVWQYPVAHLNDTEACVYYLAATGTWTVRFAGTITNTGGKDWR